LESPCLWAIALDLGSCERGEIAARLPSIPLIMCAWIVGALFSLVGAWSLSEVGAVFPSAGAYYTVARRAFGDYVSFVVGWTDCVSLCGAMATITILAGEYFGDLVPRLANHNVSVAMGLVLLLALIQSPASHQWFVLPNLALGPYECARPFLPGQRLPNDLRGAGYGPT
jgi:amino acid transporter